MSRLVLNGAVVPKIEQNPRLHGYINGVNLDIDGGFFAALATGRVDYRGRE